MPILNLSQGIKSYSPSMSTPSMHMWMPILMLPLCMSNWTKFREGSSCARNLWSWSRMIVNLQSTSLIFWGNWARKMRPFVILGIKLSNTLKNTAGLSMKASRQSKSTLGNLKKTIIYLNRRDISQFWLWNGVRDTTQITSTSYMLAF